MGIIMSTSNCVGGVCLDLNDVFNFITKIKTLDLYGYAHPRKCCADGTQIDPSCGSCDDSQRLNGIKREDACIFSYCFSWAELYAKLGEVKTAYNNNELVPLLVASAAGLFTWLGYQGETVFANHLPQFWKTTGSFIAITSGICSAVWAGTNTVNAAVKSEYWKNSGTISSYRGANFLTYGGNGWLSGALGAFEVSWVIAYLSLGIEIAVMPFVLATNSDKYYAAKYAGQGLGSKKAASMDWIVLGSQFLTAFGCWTGAKALQTSSTTLINFFDIQNTDGVSLYNSAFGSNPSWDNSTALLADLGNHSLIVLFYYILAAVISNLAFWFTNAVTTAP